MFLGSFIGDAVVSYQPIFLLSPATAPEVSARVDSAQFLSRSLKEMINVRINLGFGETAHLPLP